MPGLGAQCASRDSRPCEVTRPVASSTRTLFALQGFAQPGTVSMARAKRGSRTVKYARQCQTSRTLCSRWPCGPWRICLLEHRDAVACLHQGAGARNASHACADDGEVARPGVGVEVSLRRGRLEGGNGFAHGLPFRGLSETAEVTFDVEY